MIRRDGGMDYELVKTPDRAEWSEAPWKPGATPVKPDETHRTLSAVQAAENGGAQAIGLTTDRRTALQEIQRNITTRSVMGGGAV